MDNTKFINTPDNLMPEVLAGAADVFRQFLTVFEGHIILRRDLATGVRRVVPMTLGGVGHEPCGMGFIGKGWENIKVLGGLYSGPDAEAVLKGIHIANEAGGGKGVFIYCGNYPGDISAARAAVGIAAEEGIRAELLPMTDDCSFFGREKLGERLDLCCAPVLSRLLGAASEAGYGLDQMHALGKTFMDNTAALCAATRGATHPVTGTPMVAVPEGRMVIGMGPGSYNTGLGTSSEAVKLLLSHIIPDIGLKSGDEVIVTVNGGGATSLTELLIIYNDIRKQLGDDGIKIHSQLVGTFIAVQEQSGFTVNIVRVDNEMKKLFDSPCRTAYITKL